MSNDSLIALVSNVCLLATVVFVYDLLNLHLLKLENRLQQVIMDLRVNALAVMVTPWASKLRRRS